jgi:hypothetical protein
MVKRWGYTLVTGSEYQDSPQEYEFDDMSTDSHEPKKNAEHIESPVPGDSEKGTNAGVEEITAFKHAERRLVRKLDMVLVPLTALLYLAAFLVRTFLV